MSNLLNNEMNRRQASGVVLSAAALATLLRVPGAGVALAAQPAGIGAGGTKKTSKGPSDFEKLLRPGKTHDWTLKVIVNVAAFVETDSKGMPVIHDFDLTSATVVFPILKTTASHKVYTNEVTGTLKFNDVVKDRFDGASPDRDQRMDQKACGTRLAKWSLKNEKGREVELEVWIPCTCWETIFDEKKAEKVAWPASWPTLPASTFTDVQMVRQDPRRGVSGPLIDHQDSELRALVTEWCDEKDPKSIKPVPLAKFLATRVLEYIQPSGDGLNSSDNGLLEGLSLQGSASTIRNRKGSEHDIACVLAAAYRSVGLPTRVVIGYDTRDEKGDDEKNFLSRKRDGAPNFRSWVEFCLYDETEKVELWVPVDINRQRKMSSRVSAWKFFGTNDEFDQVIPFAHQYHPPTSVMAHGSLSFWGWLTLPEAQIARQFLRFTSQTTPKTANTKRDRERAEEDEQKPATNPPPP